jgi:CubicO group peptidase (beta-lactamase class C family)
MTTKTAPFALAAAALAAGLLASACLSAPAGRVNDRAGLERAAAELAEHPEALALLVERDGAVVLEQYYHGAKPDGYYDVRSVTKSVVSVLYGIALGEGRLPSLDLTVGEALGAELPGLNPPAAGITARQLLAMTSGLPWKELNSEEQDYEPFIASPDPLRWILARPLEAPPGTCWNYNTGACHILSAMLTKAVGMSARDYAQSRLFGPLDEKIGGWETDPRGYNYGGHGICLTPRGLLKLGRLMLDGGAWRGRRIVPAAWVEESTGPFHATGRPMGWGSGYGYLWWTDDGERTPPAGPFFFATGYGGQFIVCSPSKNAVVVAVSDWTVRNQGMNWYHVMGIIAEKVLPCLR